jgi:hypothetical protein
LEACAFLEAKHSGAMRQRAGGNGIESIVQDELCNTNFISLSITSHSVVPERASRRANPESIRPHHRCWNEFRHDEDCGKRIPHTLILPVVPICRTSLALRCRANQTDALARPAPDQEGRFAIVTNVGSGMRWTRRVTRRMTLQADGEVAWS